jgi:hypothetical protein
MGWRDHLSVHPAADLFPLMSETELRELGENIRADGLVSPIVLHQGKLLDGRNRLDAMELVGIKMDWAGDYINKLDGFVVELTGGRDPYGYVISANLHRRHLTTEQKRELIAKVLKAKPGESNRKIAKQVKADDKTVAKVRRDLESTAEIPQLEKTTGGDGKQRKKRADTAERNRESRRHDGSDVDNIIEFQANSDVITVEDELDQSEYREAFLLRAADAMAFAVYSGEVDKEVIAAAKRVAATWKNFAQTLATESDVTENEDDIVEQCLSLIVAMNKEQRAQFFARYTELSAARAPARPKSNTTNAAD